MPALIKEKHTCLYLKYVEHYFYEGRIAHSSVILVLTKALF